MSRQGIILSVILITAFGAAAYFFPVMSNISAQHASRQSIGCVSPMPGPDASGRGVACGSHY